MLTSRMQALLGRLAQPANLLRLGLLVFLLTTLVLRLPFEFNRATNPDSAQAISCSGGKCESAGACWSEGTTGYNGDNGCKYKCSGGSWKNEDCNTSQQEKDTAKANKAKYDQQVAAQQSGGSGAPGSGVGVSGGAVCGSGSASGCSGKPFYTTVSGLVCFPNGVNNQGVTLCGRDTPDKVKVVTDPATGKPVGANVVATNDSQGGCALVVQCGCASGMQSLCLRDANMLANEKASDYCARVVCSPIGSNGKICTPGQVSECNGTVGKICNADGKSYSNVNAHACGATHTVAYCSQRACIRSSETYPNCPGGFKCVGTTYNSETQCTQQTGASSCDRGVAQISQSITVVQNVANYCTQVACKDAGTAYSQCLNACSAEFSDPQKAIAAGICAPGSNFKLFKGCGTGSQSRYNCYNTCTNGKAGSTCINEPGLSCGAHQVLTPTQQAVASIIQTRTVVEPTPPPPTPTPIPKATCGESCGSGVVCSGSNMACVSGTCRSTLCAPSEQNNQCICQPPPPVAPMCIDIWASKTAPVLNDQVTFTCAQVDNTERYEFRVAFTQNKTSLEGAQVVSLAPASSTSNVSQPITIDKVGRYVAQCRPCAANDLCQEWEPLDGQIGPPELAPADAAIVAAQSAAGTSTTTTEETTETATESGQTATESGTTQ